MFFFADFRGGSRSKYWGRSNLTKTAMSKIFLFWRGGWVGSVTKVPIIDQIYKFIRYLCIIQITVNKNIFVVQVRSGQVKHRNKKNKNVPSCKNIKQFFSIDALFCCGKQPLIQEENNCFFFSLWQIPNLHFKIHVQTLSSITARSKINRILPLWL